MGFLSRPLQKEKFSYSSIKTKSDLVGDIKEIFSEKCDNESTRLSGKFTSDNEFYITGKIPSFGTPGKVDTICLKGKITGQGDKVVIDLVVKPVPRIYVQTFTPILFGLAFLCYIIFHYPGIGLAPLLYSIIFIILIPLAMLSYGQTSKDKLRKRFVEILKLTAINRVS